MNREDLIKFEQLKASGFQMRVYYAYLHLKENNQRYPTVKEMADYIGYEGKSYERTIGRCLKFLRDNNLIPDNPGTYRPSRNKPEKKCGIYSIKTNAGMYVGQSKNIAQRWKEHRRNAKLQIHRYISSEDNLEFSVLEECNKTQLSTKELLWANKLHSECKNILNKENFMFITEDK